MHEQGSGFSSTFRGTGSRVPSHVKNVEGNTCRRPPGGEVNSTRYCISTASPAAFSQSILVPTRLRILRGGSNCGQDDLLAWDQAST